VNAAIVRAMHVLMYLWVPVTLFVLGFAGLSWWSLACFGGFCMTMLVAWQTREMYVSLRALDTEPNKLAVSMMTVYVIMCTMVPLTVLVTGFAGLSWWSLACAVGFGLMWVGVWETHDLYTGTRAREKAQLRGDSPVTEATLPDPEADWEKYY
jgi:hypothetical protein